MAYVQLQGGSYTSRSLISAAQRCLNLYPEGVPNIQGEPSPYSHLPTPGLTLLSTYPNASTAPSAAVRCLYTSANGALFAVAGQDVYFIDANWIWYSLGTLTPTSPKDATPRTTPVSMVDNGLTMLIVDGSVDGWIFKMDFTAQMQPIDPSNASFAGFSGGTRVDFSDTFFIVNKPASGIFYTSASEAVMDMPQGQLFFDPLDFASKTAKADPLVTLIVEHRVIWLLGTQTTEVWYNTGGGGAGALANNTFPYEALPGTFFDKGCAAPYSAARADNRVFWLSADVSGQSCIMMGRGYNADRISTHAIETELSTYPTLSDAIGFCYTQQGHVFYVLTFPTADKTWCYDATMNLWHERCYIDSNGKEHRHRANCTTFAYGKNIVGDFENGNIYSWDLNNYTDYGQPIKRLRSFPHMLDAESNRRVFYKSLIANMEVGAGDTSNTQVITSATFDAVNGTLLQNYVGDIGARFTKVGGSIDAQIVNDAVIGITPGSAEYTVSGTPFGPDYSISFRAIPENYHTLPALDKFIAVIGRGTADLNGYWVGVGSDGVSNYSLGMAVLGTSTIVYIAMGIIASGYFLVQLTMNGTMITATCQRSVDGYWLESSGTWSPSFQTAISITDSRYPDKGVVRIGGFW